MTYITTIIAIADLIITGTIYNLYTYYLTYLPIGIVRLGTN